jgi:hypothetical protein
MEHPLFCYLERCFSGFMLCLPAQIRVELRVHQSQFEVSKSGLKRSEQKCSHLARGNSPQIEREEIYLYFFRMKPRLVPEVVNSAQTSERREIKSGSPQNGADEPPIRSLRG